MPEIVYTSALQDYGPDPQDRVAVLETESGLLIAVADGAGGTSHGGWAADLVVAGLRDLADRKVTHLGGSAWKALLAGLGSDGLFRYAPGALIRETALQGTPGEACRALLDLDRLPGGTLK